MEQYILKYLFERKNLNRTTCTTAETCRLCRAINREPYLPLKYGYILDAKYPAVPNSKLYIQKDCTTVASLKNILEIINFLDQHPKTLCVCNMLNEPTIPTHWHAHLFDKMHLPKHQTEKWLNLSRKLSEKKLHKISNKGIYYLYPYRSLTSYQKAQLILNYYKIFSNILNNNHHILLSINPNYFLFSIVHKSNQKFSISSHALYGYFYTSKLQKALYMMQFGIENILEATSQSSERDISIFSEPVTRHKFSDKLNKSGSLLV